ncbi:MAG: biotin transporter BioY [Alphaproteobacteria bacterium]
MNVESTASPFIERYLPANQGQRIATTILLAVVGSLLLWASAKVKIPFYPVEMTMQTFVIMGIAATYGSRLAVATVLLYFAEGALGIPVFTGTPEKGLGLAYMAGSTGGFLLGFPIAAFFIGWLAERGFDRSFVKLFAAMLVGDAIIFALGLLWLGTLFGWDKPILEWGLYPFILGDLTKIALAACLVVAVARKGRPNSG